MSTPLTPYGRHLMAIGELLMRLHATTRGTCATCLKSVPRDELDANDGTCAPCIALAAMRRA